MKACIPNDLDFARERGWTHQVDWQDPNGPPCFHRFTNERAAMKTLDDLETEAVNGRKIIFTDLRPILYPKVQ